MKPTLANVKRYAEQLGATVEVTKTLRQVSIHIDAPLGKCWSCDGELHSLLTWGYIRVGADGYADLLDRMSYGLCDCVNPDCDVCH